MILRSSMCRGAKAGVGLAASDSTLDFNGLCRNVNMELMRVCSLWSRRESMVARPSSARCGDLMMLAARHLGYRDSEQLWLLTPQGKQGKLPCVVKNTRIVYQDGITDGVDGQQSDIWLGHSRLRSYVVLNFQLPSAGETIQWLKTMGTAAEEEPLMNEVEAEHRNAMESQHAGETSSPETTFFIYPYTRQSSRMITDTIYKHRFGLDELDMRSMVYMCGSTGSSRALRLLDKLIRENCHGNETTSAIHRVEEHAWPWMNEAPKKSTGRIGVPLVMDALCSAAIIRYTFEKESGIFDYVESVLQKLDAKVKEGGNEVSVEIKELDEAVLTRVVNLLILKRNFSQFNSDHIRVFSDFICDRLHRIDARSIANIAFALGHCKHLDEFWMFMMAKRIQDSPSDFGPDEVAAIMDAYSNACLEDYDFYVILCKEVARRFDQYSIHHLTVILRALARVRVRDEWLLGSVLEKLEKQLVEMEKTGEIHNTSRELAYVTANCVVAAGDLGYAGECRFDSMWRLLTSRIKESSFDICAINWLPLAAMTFASRTTLQTFMPTWLRHVSYTMQKLRSKAFVLTIQRRHHLVRHVFRLGILPLSLLPRSSQRLLDDICDREMVATKICEDYVPESSTFHLEVCACLRALDVVHQREINIVPFVMDIVVPPKREYRVKSPQICEAHRHSDEARSGQIDELSASGFRLKYTRHSPNHRKRKQEIYIYDKNNG